MDGDGPALDPAGCDRFRQEARIPRPKATHFQAREFSHPNHLCVSGRADSEHSNSESRKVSTRRLGENLKDILKAGRPDLLAVALVLQGPVAIGRFLLAIAAISALTTPITQDLWTWDHFLRGGQDFETGMLTIVSILCLSVLLSQLCRIDIDLLFSVHQVLAFIFKHGELPGNSPVRAFFIFRMERVNGAALGRYSLPMKI